MKKIFFTSDNHWYHKNILKYSNRPFADVNEMQYVMRNKWNETVGQDDKVYMLGDVGFSDGDKLATYIKSLNGEKHLILGNHDRNITKNRKTFNEKVFRSIKSYNEININGQFIVLSHYAMRVWNKSHYGSWMLFGHTHGQLSPYGKSVDVGVDSPFITGEAPYRPFSFDEIKTFMDKQEQHEKYDKR